MRAQKTIVKWKLLGIAIFTISSVHPSKTAAEKHVKRLKKRLGIKATMAPLDPPGLAGNRHAMAIIDDPHIEVIDDPQEGQADLDARALYP